MDYIKHVLNDSNLSFVYMVIVFVTFSLLSFYETFQQRFIIIVFSLVASSIYYSSSQKIIYSDEMTINNFNKNKQNIRKIEFVLPNIYKLHENPEKFTFIYYNNHVIEVLNELSFMQNYDKSSYEMIVILLEEFLKIYCNILSGTYDERHYFHMLKDIRNHIMECLYCFYLNVPTYSTHVKGNVYGILDRNIKLIQSITYRCIKIISHKCKKKCNVDLHYKAPFPHDKYSSKSIIF